MESQISKSTVFTQGNFHQPTQKASSAPKGSTTLGNNDNNDKDVSSTQNSTWNRSETSTPIWSNTQGRNQQQQRINNDPYARLNLGKCFQCNQLGHLSNNCLNRRSVNFVEGGNEKEEVLKDDIYEGAEFAKGDVGEEVACIVQWLLLTLKKSDDSQQHKIFQTQCTICVECFFCFVSKQTFHCIKRNTQ